MRSYVFNGSGIAGLRQSTERRQRTAEKGEIAVRLRAASLNFRDLLVANGQYGECKADLVPLSDGAGEIVELGEGVTDFVVGDRVALTFHADWVDGKFSPHIDPTGRGGGNMDGVLQEYACVKQTEAVKLPEHLSFEEGATLPCAGVTAWTALTQYSELLPGDVVVVQGTGGVSVFALQLAKIFGARVIALSSTEKKLALLRNMGADELINYSENPDWHERVLALTDGIGADLVVEVAGAETFEKSAAATRMGGRISVIGLLTGMPALGSTSFLRMQSIHPIRVGSREHFLQLNRALALHKLKPLVDSVFGFDQTIAAFEYFENRKHVGKVVISI